MDLQACRVCGLIREGWERVGGASGVLSVFRWNIGLKVLEGWAIECWYGDGRIRAI